MYREYYYLHHYYQRSFIRELLLNVPSLEEVRNVLYNGLREFFNELEVEMVSCPLLTSSPYNLAADGLSGSTAIVTVNDGHTLIPDLQRKLNCNVPHNLIDCYEDFFLIGGGYAARPFSLYNGHISTNVSFNRWVKFNYINVNSSCIAYEEAATGQKILQSINDMTCSMLGNFFVSEGKPGMVIKVRAKGRKTTYDILTLMQYSLITYFPNTEVALGGVLRINGGRVIQFVTPENYPSSFSEPRDFFSWLNIHEVICNDLITVGALFNKKTLFNVGQYGDNGPAIIGSRYKFYSTMKSRVAGQFINDITPNETEYIGYFNVAQEVYSFNED